MGMPKVSGTAQRCLAVLTTFLLAVDTQSSETALLHSHYTVTEAKHNAMLQPASWAIGINRTTALWASVFITA